MGTHSRLRSHHRPPGRAVQPLRGSDWAKKLLSVELSSGIGIFGEALKSFIELEALTLFKAAEHPRLQATQSSAALHFD